LPHGFGHSQVQTEESSELQRRLTRARKTYLEEPGVALEEVLRCYEVAFSQRNPSLCARAQAVQGLIALHRGDVRGAMALALDAMRLAEQASDLEARAEWAALQGQLNFFSGSYAEALSLAERAVEIADQTGDSDLRIFVRRVGCVVFGNLEVPNLLDKLEELLSMSIAMNRLWDEAVSRNDLACYLQSVGEIESAEHELALALEVLSRTPPPTSFAEAIVLSTRADLRLISGDPAGALADAEQALKRFAAGAQPNPYVLGVKVREEVQALMELGRIEEAMRSGEGALALIGDRVPQTRSLILSTLAGALRQAGRFEEAYETLVRASELEHQALRELLELQLGLERATLAAKVARSHSATLTARNRQLSKAHAELANRTEQLERQQSQLREQADHDWLTGLHNRRFLAAQLQRMAAAPFRGPVSLAILDLDHFKDVNDRFGHAIGDRVLARIAEVLVQDVAGEATIVRSGGEEFLLVLPATEGHEAVQLCETVRDSIRSTDWSKIADGLMVTTSIGVAWAAESRDVEQLLPIADGRLYAAKRAGRDRVIAADDAR
jgi:diguanylate cyclase (GGDEF)-like protein